MKFRKIPLRILKAKTDLSKLQVRNQNSRQPFRRNKADSHYVYDEINHAYSENHNTRVPIKPTERTNSQDYFIERLFINRELTTHIYDNYHRI